MRAPAAAAGPFRSPFARSVTLRCGDGSVLVRRAFLQPLSLTEPETPRPTPAGAVDPRRWLVLLEAADLTAPVELVDGADAYLLLRWEDVGGHLEGVLRRKEEGGDKNA